MKLPDFQTGPVPTAESSVTLLRASLAHKGEEVGYAWQRGAQAAHGFAQLGQDIAEVGTSIEMSEAVMRYHAAKNDAEREVAGKGAYSVADLEKMFGGRENIPDSIKQSVPGGLTKDLVGEDGKVVTVDKSDIPRWAVAPEYIRQKTMSAAQAAADGITFPGAKRRFLEAVTRDSDEAYTRHAAAAQEELTHYQNARVLTQAEYLMNQGMFEEAKEQLNFATRMAPEDRQKAEQEILKRQGTWGMFEPFSGQDMTLIHSTMEGLRSGENKFNAVDSNGQIHPVDVTAIPVDSRRKHASLLEQYGKDILNNAEHERKEKLKEYGDTVQNSWLRALGTENPAIIGQTFQKIMKDLAPSLPNNVLKEIVDSYHSRLRQQKEDQLSETPANVFKMNFAAALAAAKQPGGGQFIVGGQSYNLADLSPLQFNALARANGVKPKDVPALVTELGRAQAGKQQSDASKEKNVNAALDRAGYVFSDDDKDAKTARRADLRATLLDHIEDVNRKRGKPLSPEEERQELDTFLRQLPKTALTSSPSEVSGYNGNDIRDIVRWQGQIAQQYGGKPFESLAEAVKARQDVEPYVKLTQEMYPVTAAHIASEKAGKPFGEKEATRAALEIRAQKASLTGQVLQSGKKPTDRNIVNQYFLNKGFYGDFSK